MIHFREVFGKVDGDTSVGVICNKAVCRSLNIHWNSGLSWQRVDGMSDRYWQLTDWGWTLSFVHNSLHMMTPVALKNVFSCPSVAQTLCSPVLQLHKSPPAMHSSAGQSHFTPTDPAPEPMIIVRQRLSSAERQRRLTRGLCLYCGAQGHIILACPLRPPRPVVSAILPKIVKMEPLTTCVTLTASNVSISVSALLDSGSAGNFISWAPCHQLSLKATTTKIIYQVQWITGKPLSRRHVRHRVGPITLRIGLFHTEDIHLLVLEGSMADIILGRPWLVQSHKIQAQSYPVMENRGSPEAGQGFQAFQAASPWHHHLSRLPRKSYR